MYKETWKDLKYSIIFDIYQISSFGRVKNKRDEHVLIDELYHSSNGYDFIRLNINEWTIYGEQYMRYFPLDDLVAATFCKCPDELIGKPIKVEHIDGNLRNNHYENLRWVEDIEEWRDIPNFENIYKINQYGVIKHVSDNYILKPHYDKDGYPDVKLVHKNAIKYLRNHRIVVMCFHDKYDPILPVNHIDENKVNNYFKNLEQISVTENNVFGQRLLKSSTKSRHSVICLETGIRYSSASHAEKETGINASMIIAVCIGARKTAGLYHWMYYDYDYIPGCGRKIRCVETGEIYNSAKCLARMLNIGKGCLRRHILSHTPINGFNYEYLNPEHYERGEPPTMSVSDKEKSKNYITMLYGKSVKCIETGEIYKSIRECCRKVGIDGRCLKRHIKNHTSYNGFHYEFYTNEDV